MGSALKAEVKVGTAHEIGVRMDDLLDVAKRDMERAIGAQNALLDGSKIVLSLHGVVDKEIDAGTLDLEMAKKVKLYVTRAVTALESLAQRAANIQQVTNGRVQGLQAAVGSIKTFHDQEKAALDALVAAPPAEPPVPPTPGEVAGETRPAPLLPIKQRRLAESEAATAVIQPVSRKRRNGGRRR
jgi:hypothetical protein